MTNLLLIAPIFFCGFAVGQEIVLTEQNDSPFKRCLLTEYDEIRVNLGYEKFEKVDNCQVIGRNAQKRVNALVIKEVEDAVEGLYSVDNTLVDMKVGNRDRKLFDFSSRLGIAGIQTKATGVLSRKHGSTIDINYQFSVESLVMNGNGHRLMLVTKF